MIAKLQRLITDLTSVVRRQKIIRGVGILVSETTTGTIVEVDMSIIPKKVSNPTTTNTTTTSTIPKWG